MFALGWLFFFLSHRLNQRLHKEHSDFKDRVINANLDVITQNEKTLAVLCERVQKRGK